MKITVYQAKGSAGKTPIATNIVLDREYAIGTNEAFHVFDGFIPDDRLLVLDLTESFPDMPDGIDIVFDLAGAISAQSHSLTVSQYHISDQAIWFNDCTYLQRSKIPA